jgi:hypothetical protein
MHTISGRAETRTISIAAPPSTVFDFVGDARNLPKWAPGFAPNISASGDEWVVDYGTEKLRLIVRVSREYGTIDFLRAEDPRTGGFSRVLPNGEGAEYQFTVIPPAGTPDAAVADQLKNIEEELETVRKFCEAA